MDRNGASKADSGFEAGTSYASKFLQTWVAICTGSAEVTEGCHMRFSEYTTRIFALLQEDGMGKGKSALEVIGLPPSVLLCCHCCPSQTAPQTVSSSAEGLFQL